MVSRLKKSTRRRRQTRKSSRKMRRRQRGGGNTYTFTVAMPIGPTSTATGFPAELGTFTAGNQNITFTNPTKTITDIMIGGQSTATGAVSNYNKAVSYTVSSGTKVSIQIGSTMSLVPNGVVLRGTTPLPGAAATAATHKGEVVIKGLNNSSFPAPAPTVLTFTVYTLD